MEETSSSDDESSKASRSEQNSDESSETEKTTGSQKCTAQKKNKKRKKTSKSKERKSSDDESHTASSSEQNSDESSQSEKRTGSQKRTKHNKNKKSKETSESEEDTNNEDSGDDEVGKFGEKEKNPNESNCTTSDECEQVKDVQIKKKNLVTIEQEISENENPSQQPTETSKKRNLSNVSSEEEPEATRENGIISNLEKNPKQKKTIFLKIQNFQISKIFKNPKF